MPWIVVFNVVVLAPIALLSIYGITCMIGGRSFGYLASLIWVVFPVAVIHYFSAGYHARYVDITLPPALGLTARGDFPSFESSCSSRPISACGSSRVGATSTRSRPG